MIIKKTGTEPKDCSCIVKRVDEIRGSLFDDPSNGLADFPNYKLVFQNEGELLYLTPIQVNLLAHMWGYTVSTGFKTSGYAFGQPSH